jgi:hypothetical protein
MSSRATDSSPSHPQPWAVAVLASREQTDELMATVRALLAAALKPTTVDMLINGNLILAQSVSQLIADDRAGLGQARIRVWYLALGDKANAWNQYVHGVWPGADCTFFVDGYARVAAQALDRLDNALAGSATALVATGVPSSGRTAASLRAQALREGSLHGNLFAVRQGMMNELRGRNIRLPLGLYGYDGLIGAIFAFALDPSQHEWDAKNRILVSADVTWTHEAKKWWRPADLKSQFQRMSKQSLRALVVCAVRDFLHIRRNRPEHLPRTLAELVISWAQQHPLELRTMCWRRPISRYHLWKLRSPRDWSLAYKPPLLVSDSEQ